VRVSCILARLQPRIQLCSGGYDVRRDPPDRSERTPSEKAIMEVRAMKRIRIEKPKLRRSMELELPLRLDPRDPDVVRVKRGAIWRFADRRWA